MNRSSQDIIPIVYKNHRRSQNVGGVLLLQHIPNIKGKDTELRLSMQCSKWLVRTNMVRTINSFFMFDQAKAEGTFIGLATTPEVNVKKYLAMGFEYRGGGPLPAPTGDMFVHLFSKGSLA